MSANKVRTESTQQINLLKEQKAIVTLPLNHSEQQLITSGSPKENEKDKDIDLPRRLETPRDQQRPYPFKFSTSQELGGTGCCFKLWLVIFILLYASLFPLAYLYSEYIDVDQNDVLYSTYLYVLLFNGLVLGIGGYSIVGCVAYPYSKQFLQADLKRTTNERFSTEFIKCTDRIVRLISNMAETQSAENASAILTA